MKQYRTATKYCLAINTPLLRYYCLKFESLYYNRLLEKRLVKDEHLKKHVMNL